MQYEGKWWFPKYENNKFAGTLSFTHKNGGRLLIKGIISPELESDQDFYSNNDKVILGQTSNGKNITLQIYKVHTSINVLSNESSFEFDVEFIFEGIHFKKPEDIKFDSLRVYYQNCDKWFSKPTLYKVISNKKIKKYSYHNPIIIKDENRFEYEIKIFAETKIKYENRKPILIKKIYANIISKDKNSFKDYQNIYKIIKDFFNFLSHEEITISSIEGNYILKDGNCINHIKIFCQNFDKKMNKIKHMIPYNIRYDKISNNFRNLFLNWIKIKNELSIIYDLFFGVMYNSDLYLSNMLQMFTECLENYHREFIEKKVKVKVKQIEK